MNRVIFVIRRYIADFQMKYFLLLVAYKSNIKMKKSITTFLAVVLLFSAFAQKAKDKDYSKEDEKIYNKLVNLYTLDKFAKCIEECESYIKSESTARSPYPYLYMSMCYLAIYQDQDNFDMKKYKDPLKKSLSFMGRFKKKDKAGDVQKENADHLRDLKKATILECATLNDKKDFKNLQNLAREVAKDYDKDEAMLILSGTYLCRSDAKPEGERSIETGMAILKKKKDDGNAKYEADEYDVLAQAFLAYTDYLMDSKDVAKAKTSIQMAKDIMPGNEKISKQSDKINK